MRIPYILAFLPALGGAALAVIAYFSPNTGVDGTPGALLALLGAAAATLGALLAMMEAVRGKVRILLNTLTGLAAALTALAAYFLMQYAFAAAMGLALLGLLLAWASPSTRRTA